MSARRTRRATLAAVSAITLIALTLPSCGSSAPTSETPEISEHAVAYTVRGRIFSLPDPARPAAELQIHHEELPSFMSGGEVVGMSAMIMPFPDIATGVSLDGLNVGQAVTFTFHVEYDPDTQMPVGMLVTAIAPLPQGTALTID